MRNLTDIVGWAFLIVGALVAVIAKPVLKKMSGDGELHGNAIFIWKTLALIAVVIGAAIIFISGGSFGV